jgi:hypothetical protein
MQMNLFNGEDAPKTPKFVLINLDRVVHDNMLDDPHQNQNTILTNSMAQINWASDGIIYALSGSKGFSYLLLEGKMYSINLRFNHPLHVGQFALNQANIGHLPVHIALYDGGNSVLEEVLRMNNLERPPLLSLPGQSENMSSQIAYLVPQTQSSSGGD